MKLPLFPLGSVICPGGRIPLQLFEPRYLDMLSRCMREESTFVIVLIEEGVDTGGACRFFAVGTEVAIVDFSQLPNGLLGITAEGRRIVRVHDFSQAPDQLYVGDVELLPEESPCPVGEDFAELQDILRTLLAHPVVRNLGMQVDIDDARHVSWRLTELLPMKRGDKQRLLECPSAPRRLEMIMDLLPELA